MNVLGTCRECIRNAIGTSHYVYQYQRTPWTVLLNYSGLYKLGHCPWDLLDFWQDLSLGVPALGLCSAWRYGEFWRFGDHQQNGLVYSDATNQFMNTPVWVYE